LTVTADPGIVIGKPGLPAHMVPPPPTVTGAGNIVESITVTVALPDMVTGLELDGFAITV